jgi:hypothetical protein
VAGPRRWILVCSNSAGGLLVLCAFCKSLPEPVEGAGPMKPTQRFVSAPGRLRTDSWPQALKRDDLLRRCSGTNGIRALPASHHLRASYAGRAALLLDSTADAEPNRKSQYDSISISHPFAKVRERMGHPSVRQCLRNKTPPGPGPPARRIVEKLGFQKLRVAHNAATRCLDGTKLDRHEYILTSPNALPELDVSWG